MIDPKSVVCPDCEAAVGAMCRMIQNGNITYVSWIHVSRLNLALNPPPPATTSTQPAPEPPPEELQMPTESEYRTY